MVFRRPADETKLADSRFLFRFGGSILSLPFGFVILIITKQERYLDVMCIFDYFVIFIN